MKAYSIIPVVSLQLFAEGAADGGTAQGQGVTAGAASQHSAGVKANPLADVKYGIQPEEAPSVAGVEKTAGEQADPAAEFEKLIKGQYKQQYDARVQDTMRQRLKGKDGQIADLTSRQKAVEPILELLGRRYGVDTGDIAALSRAIEADDSYFESAAEEHGMSVDQYRQFRKLERENEDLRRAAQDRKDREQADRLYAQWNAQAQEAKGMYPGLDLKAELQNPKFLDLLRSNIDVKTAYEVIHKDEIIPAAMHIAAKNVESKLAKKIASGGRPVENGVGSGSAAVVKSDVSKLSRNDIDEVMRRVARGERVTFG